MKAEEIRRHAYLRHRGALVDYATPLLGSRDAAEDVVQDAFLRFTPETIRGEAAEQTLAYLYRIVRNLAFDVLKRRKTETRHAGDNLPFWATPTPQPSPEQSLLLADQARMVSAVLAELPQDARIAVEMHRFGGFTLAEIASHLQISTATAHRHVRSAMLKIALRLGNQP